MKPDWIDAPEWARWRAMDSSGAWYWFKNEPKELNQFGWVEKDCKEANLPGWKDSAEARPIMPGDTVYVPRKVKNTGHDGTIYVWIFNEERTMGFHPDDVRRE
tara:strand:- start:482 stop:790 length:309 start_codon:yes stop_codon:yes gene_type:complete